MTDMQENRWYYLLRCVKSEYACGTRQLSHHPLARGGGGQARRDIGCPCRAAMWEQEPRGLPISDKRKKNRGGSSN
jgi:hypothetical protein